MSFILPWFIAGPLIGLFVPLILLLKEKQFGVSSSFRVLGGVILPKLPYFKYEKQKDYWQVAFVFGLVLVSVVYSQLTRLGSGLDSEESVYVLANWSPFLLGGVAVGFGARYAGGCTAGHCIMGNALFAKSSIVTTVSFFVGGLLTSHFINPLIFE